MRKNKKMTKGVDKNIIILAIISSFVYIIFFCQMSQPQEEIKPVKGQIIKGKIASYWERLPNNVVHCLLCPRSCIIPPGKTGTCQARENINGTLYTLTYGNPCAVHVDPIEKKPFFHFLPKTLSFSIATAGCNVRCIHCQNWEISQASPKETFNYILTPKDIATLAKRTGSATVAYTYTEPIIFIEYVLECAKETKKLNLRNVMHSNGYINVEPLKELCGALDAINIDLKGFRDEVYNELMQGAKLSPVLNTLKTIKSYKNVWLEITNLIIPTKNDDPRDINAMCSWIYKNLGPDVPLHFSRFYPNYLLTSLPSTPIQTLENAYKIAKKNGLRYVYIGNVPGSEYEDTYCWNCGRKLIDRQGFTVISNHIVDGKCKFCHARIAGVWQ